MRRHSVPVFLVILSFLCGPSGRLSAQSLVRINEFMAVNDTGLDDVDRDEEDWIELYNAGTETVDLAGWYLTDKANNLTKWQFPSLAMYPDAYLIVFASEKDRRDPEAELHANFKLSAHGEYLALVAPDGKTVVSEFGSMYPIQVPDVSYGIKGVGQKTVLLAQGARARALIPENDSLEPKRAPRALIPGRTVARPWTLEEVDESGWLTGTTGVGYGFSGLIGLDVSDMRGNNQTLYIRIPFEVDAPSMIEQLTLRLRYSDGMIAYLNGREVARDNAPLPNSETWHSSASNVRSNAVARTPVELPIMEFGFLHEGTNVLAIQGLNHDISSPELLVLPELWVEVTAEETQILNYFQSPTPGRPNHDGIDRIGPSVSNVNHMPQRPLEGEALFITAEISPTFDEIAFASLHYRIGFNAEVSIPLQSASRLSHTQYGALIPSGVLTPGQMVRWYITATDTQERQTRSPSFLDPQNSPQYFGTVVENPDLTNPLPVLHWFIQNSSAANTNSGTRCSLFYEGEFYDNVLINLHGQSSRGFPKKSYDVDFHPGYNFKWAEGEPRADDINLMTTYPDKAHMRNILAYETYRDADCPYHWVFPVRVEQNGDFWGTAHVMENGDEDWLVRMGINAEGALYKMYNTFSSTSHATSGAEKKTRQEENNYDLQALYAGLNLPNEARQVFLYDHVDVSQVVNFLALMTITGDTDCCHKNYYFYRDTGVSDEWQMWPWDVDLTFGRRWIGSKTYWDQNLIVNTRLFVGNNNTLPKAIFDTPHMRQMYLRRVRTLMDEFLKPPGTAERDLYYEPRMDQLALQISPDAALDAAKWNSHAWGNGSTAPCCPQTLWEAVDEMRYVYFPERRLQLYYGLAQGAREIPEAQPTETVIDFGRLGLHPVNSDPDEAYIQLYNTNKYAVDISGWVLEGRANYTFRGGTVLPAKTRLYVVANRAAFRARTLFPSGGYALFIAGNFHQSLASTRLTLTNKQQQVVSSIDNIDSYIPPEFPGSTPHR